MRQVTFKFRCNLLISGKIIKEMPSSVASGTHCITRSKRHKNFGVYSTPTLVTPMFEFLYTPLAKILIYWVLPFLLGELTGVLTDKATIVTSSYNFKNLTKSYKLLKFRYVANPVRCVRKSLSTHTALYFSQFFVT